MSTKKPPQKRFRKFYYRGIDIIDLIDRPFEEFENLLPARMRRKLKRGSKNREIVFKKKMKKAKDLNSKRAASGRTKVVKTHLRNALITPDMISTKIAVYNGMDFIEFEVRQTMIGHYTGEFSPTKVLKKFGKKDAKGAKSMRFLPLK